MVGPRGEIHLITPRDMQTLGANHNKTIGRIDSQRTSHETHTTAGGSDAG
jgi:hypothetical protein